MAFINLPNGTVKKVRPKVPVVVIPTQSPSSWFADHSGSRPFLDLTLTSETLEISRGIIKRKISNCTLTVETANTFLFHFLGTVKSKLNEEWRSYERLIGEADKDITPIKLLTVQTTLQAQTEAADISTEKDDPWMALYLLSVYRLTKAKIPEYKSQINKRISDQMASLGSGDVRMTEAVDSYASWGVNKQYNMLVAATDMFFSKFPNHAYANLRIGTTGSRYRDCSALLSYGYITELIGHQDMENFLYWIFVPAVGAEIDEMMSGEEEIEKMDSYFPYQMDMGLVQKSKYSAAANKMLLTDSCHRMPSKIAKIC